MLRLWLKKMNVKYGLTFVFDLLLPGSLLDTAYDHYNSSKRSDYNTLKSTFDHVISCSYQMAKGHVAMRLVPCPYICADAVNVLSR